MSQFSGSPQAQSLSEEFMRDRIAFSTASKEHAKRPPTHSGVELFCSMAEAASIALTTRLKSWRMLMAVNKRRRSTPIHSREQSERRSHEGRALD